MGRSHRTVALALILVGCGPLQAGEAGVILPDLTLHAVGPSPVVSGTRLMLAGGGFVPAEVADLTVRFDGAVGGRRVSVAATPERLADDLLAVAVAGGLRDVLLAEAGTFSGEVIVERTLSDSGRTDRAALQVELALALELTPTLTALSPPRLYPGDAVTLSGAGFLHPSEGFSLVRLDGVFTTVSPPDDRTVSGLVVPAAPPQPAARDALEFTLTADVLGIRPGVFDGTITVVNQPLAGGERSSAPLALDGLPLERAYLDAVAPRAASRGQRVRFLGRGLLPPDNLLQASSLLVLEGVFDPFRGPTVTFEGVSALTLFPDEVVGNTELGVVLRVDQDVDGELIGLGRDPGVFSGTITPVLLAGPDAVMGRGLETTFTIKLPTQVVYLKLLPTFDEALVDFGLLAERAAVLARIEEVCRRDYAGINIAFTWAAPTDFVEYSTVWIGGHDPNGTGLFGLDNTAGKDVGNIRFDDIIGGFNAETRAQGYAAYGGIFVAEFVNFSPTVSGSDIASPRFDDIFAPVSPLLGGAPAEPGIAGDGSGRGAVIAEAVRVLGGLIGTTITHEVGHSLGLAAIEGRFHNEGDNLGWIMDAGVFRPFEERAEIDGYAPAVFSPFNREYLEYILPIAD